MKKLLIALSLCLLTTGSFILLSSKKDIAQVEKKTDTPPPENHSSNEIKELPKGGRIIIIKTLESTPPAEREKVLSKMLESEFLKKNPLLIPEVKSISAEVVTYTPEGLTDNFESKSPQSLIEKYVTLLKNKSLLEQKKQLDQSMYSPSSISDFKSNPDLELSIWQQLNRSNTERAKITAPSNILDYCILEINKNPSSNKKESINNLKQKHPAYFKKWPLLEQQIMTKLFSPGENI